MISTIIDGLYVHTLSHVSHSMLYQLNHNTTLTYYDTHIHLYVGGWVGVCVCVCVCVCGLSGGGDGGAHVGKGEE